MTEDTLVWICIGVMVVMFACAVFAMADGGDE